MNQFCTSLKARIGLLGALLTAFVAGCGGGIDPILGSPVAGIAPVVVATTPAASTPVLTVATNTRVSATFSKAMAPASVTVASFKLACPSATPVTGTVSYDAATRTASFTPTSALAANTLCVATVTTGAIDTAGFALAANFVWSFATGAAADTTPPTVTATVPANRATNVASNTQISASFSEDMAPATISASSVTLTNTTLGTAVAGTVNYVVASRTVVFTPAAAGGLPANTLFTATITTAATDLAGNAMVSNAIWTFTTAALADTTRPTVVLTIPAAGATGVLINTKISAVFSEDMDASTISGSSFRLTNTTLSTAVAGTVSYSVAARAAIFTPSSGTLAANTSYTATVTSAAADLAGNTLAANFSWSFVTAATVDLTRPTVIFTVPTAGASNVASNTKVSATFSKDMDPTTLSAGSFSLTNSTLGTAVAGTLNYTLASRTLVFTPSAAAGLAANTLFTATVTTTASDLAGNTLAANFVWTFTTHALADTTRPTVVQTVPAAGATAVPNNSKITAVFSEVMDASTISASSFTLTNSTLSTPVTGTVSYSVAAKTATFAPTSGLLANGTAYTATVTSATTDLAGNALAGNTAVVPNAGNHVWTFTTAALGDTVAPTITAVNPLDASTGICLAKTVSATFSEPMDVTTINGATFLVTDGGTSVAGSVTYDAPSQVASFTVTSAAGFAPNRSISARIVSGNSGVKDLAGNPMAADRVWSFTTGNQPCAYSINLGSAASFGGFGGAAGITNQGINTVVGGNIGTTAACTLMTGFHDASNVYTETPLNIGAVNGSVFCAPPAPGTAASMAIATQALADARSAYNALVALPPGGDPGAGQLGGLVLAPGVYTAAAGTFAITTADLTLDAKGDANAVWVFQMAGSLTVGLPATQRRVLLVNGAQARNVFWQVGSAARIEDRSVMVGTIIAPAGVTISTAGQAAQTTLTGRAIGLTASVTMVNTTIVAP